MLFGKLISLFLVSAILNPICCCNATLLAEQPPIEPLHECCDSTGTSGNQHGSAPCESEHECPLKPETISQSTTTQADLKGLGSHDPLEPTLLPPWFGVHQLAKPGLDGRDAQESPVSPARNEGAVSLRLHQAKCVYLI